MFFKVSNTAKKDEVEKEFGVDFRYPELYNPRIVINGLGEDNLDIVTMENPETIQPAIWGIMPEGYSEDWVTFQNIMNTLNLSRALIDETNWLKQSFKQKRCLVVVTGFFSSFLRKGKIHPYYLSLSSESPFYLAGLYTELYDGFLSCSLMTTKLLRPVSRYHNISDEMPLAIPESIASEWLSSDFGPRDIQNIVENPPIMNYRASPIAKDFFEENIVYDSFFQPVHHDELALRDLD